MPWRPNGKRLAAYSERAGEAFESAAALGGREVLPALAVRGVRDLALPTARRCAGQGGSRFADDHLKQMGFAWN